MRGSRPGHLAYLLRLWRIGEGKEAVWRASLQDVRTGERIGFPGLEEAFGYLQRSITEGTCSPSHRDEGNE